MSFEGYYQHICQNGHYGTEPYDYAGDAPPWKCDECGAESAWCNRVDDTNCDNCGYIEPVVRVQEHYDDKGNFVPAVCEIPQEKDDEDLSSCRTKDDPCSEGH